MYNCFFFSPFVHAEHEHRHVRERLHVSQAAFVLCVCLRVCERESHSAVRMSAFSWP